MCLRVSNGQSPLKNACCTIWWGWGLAEKVMSERENGKEEEHLAWPGNLGKIAESVGDFLLCFFFFAVVTLLPCGAHGDNMCDE